MEGNRVKFCACGLAEDQALNRKRIRPAFSMVELLTVMGVIAVLIAMLMPVMTKARQASQLVVCKSNLRQIYQAAIMFASEHHGYIQIAGKMNGANSGAPADIGDENQIHYVYYNDAAGLRPQPLPVALAPYLGHKINVSSADSIVADWNDPTCTAARVFTCPSEMNMELGMTVSDEGGWYGPKLPISYAYNEGVTGYEQNSDRRLRGQFQRANPSSEIFFLTDAVPRSDPSASAYIAWFPSDTGRSTLADYFSNDDGGTSEIMDEQFDRHRHQNRINMVFFDGHVDTLYIDDADLQHAVILPQ